MQALVALGFEIKHSGKGTTVLRREGRIVMVPHVEALSEHMLDAILRSAGVGVRDIAFATRARNRSGTYPRQRGSDDDPADSGV